jgi:hypothetical protein
LLGIFEAERERPMTNEKSIIDKVEDAAKDAFKKVEKVLDEIAADEEPVTVTYPDEDKSTAGRPPEPKIK